MHRISITYPVSSLVGEAGIVDETGKKLVNIDEYIVVHRLGEGPEVKISGTNEDGKRLEIRVAVVSLTLDADLRHSHARAARRAVPRLPKGAGVKSLGG